MPLYKSLVPVTFQGGLDQKTPSKLSVPGTFIELSDVVRRKNALLEKRDGSTALPKTTAAGGTITAGDHLASLDDQLLTFGNGKLYAYSPTLQKHSQVGTMFPCATETTPIFREAYRTAAYDTAVGGGYLCTVWERITNPDASLYQTENAYLVTDLATGVVITSGTIFSTVGMDSAGAPKVVYHSGGFTILCLDGSVLQSARINLTTLAVTTATILSGVTLFDVVEYNANAFFSAGTASGVYHGWIHSSGAVGGVGNGLTAPTIVSTYVPSYGLSVAADTARGYLWTVCTKSTAAPDAGRVIVSNATFSAFGSLNHAGLSSLLNCGAVVRSSTGGLLYYMDGYNSFSITQVLKGEVSWSGSGSPTVVTALAAWLPCTLLAAKPFFNGADEFVLVCTPDMTAQYGYYLVDAGKRMVGKAHYQSVTDARLQVTARTNTRFIPRINQTATGVYRVPAQIFADAASGENFVDNLNYVTFDFANPKFTTAKMGRSLYLTAGGPMFEYDGTQLVESGFCWYPVVQTATQGISTNGNLVAGSYSYKLVFEWTDAQGQVHRSAASPTRTTAVTGSNDTISVTVFAPTITSKPGIRLVAYMAMAGQAEVYYRVAEGAPRSLTSSTSGMAVVLQDAPDGTEQILYTTGGLIDNIQPPMVQSLTPHKGRIFHTTSEFTDAVYFSKSYTVGEAMAFNDTFRLAMPTSGGALTGLASLDSYLIIFKRSRIYALVGEGPNDAGQQWDYGDAQQIGNDVGCIDPRSIVVIPSGVMFQSEKGIYLLDRRLGLSYVGGGVEDFRDHEITSAVLLPQYSEVRFLQNSRTSDDPHAVVVAQVYNYLFNTWSVFYNYEAKGAAVIGTDFYHLKEDGTVNKEVAGQYDDNGDDVGMVIETAWLALNSLQGFQRIYKMLLLGDFVSHRILNVSIAYDYESSYTETITYDTRDLENPQKWQVDLRPARQKCQAIKLRIEEYPVPGEAHGGGFKLVAITAEVGRKSGANKLAASNRMGNT